MLVPYQKAVYTYFQNSDTLKSKFGLDKLTVSKIFIHLFNENGSKLFTVHIPRNLCKVHRLYFCVNGIISPKASQSLTEIIMYISCQPDLQYSHNIHECSVDIYVFVTTSQKVKKVIEWIYLCSCSLIYPCNKNDI